jgi:hypothetical protein
MLGVLAFKRNSRGPESKNSMTPTQTVPMVTRYLHISFFNLIRTYDRPLQTHGQKMD